MVLDIFLKIALTSPDPDAYTASPAIYRGVILLGFLRGSEMVRGLLVYGATMAIPFWILLLGLAIAVGLDGLDGSRLFTIAFAAYGTFVSVFTLRTLRDEAVQRWMFERSLPAELRDELLGG